MADNDRIASRDIPATIIPYGDPITIPSGTKVTVTHRLGGNFTVLWERGMARITGEHGDAIGEEKLDPKASENADDHQGPPDEEAIWEALRTVYDPEIPVNIVDLGLVYNMEVSSTEQNTHDVRVDMTLTAPGCGMGPAIAQDAKFKIEQVPGVHDAQVDIVWDPPWNQDMISEVGKMELGLL